MDKEAYLISKLHSQYVGDDGACVGELIYSVDAFCEEVHFKREWMSPAQIARKAMLVNLSDAVAMNAEPLYALVCIAIPETMTHGEIDALMRSLEETASEWGCEIIGGDTVGGDRLNISVTLISRSDAPLLRSGLKEGDLLAFTGTLGESKRDLRRLFLGEKIAQDSKFYEPILRKDFIRQSRRYLRVGMDLSDGLFCDTNKLLDINKSGIEVLREIDFDEGSSGEEYEMLIGFDPKYESELKKIASQTATPLTIFARVRANAYRFGCQSHHFKDER